MGNEAIHSKGELHTGKFPLLNLRFGYQHPFNHTSYFKAVPGGEIDKAHALAQIDDTEARCRVIVVTPVIRLWMAVRVPRGGMHITLEYYSK